ncbi:MAG TPA: hypothetical protein VLT83_04830 [Opitutaceae bacterium]|nr:hypothetical protein [Opitutaceae bacterium]
MSDRLQELLRQKALLDEHAAWLEREIAAERTRSGGAPVAASPAAAATPVAPAGAAPTLGPAESEADALLDQYRENPQSIHQAVKRGCLLYFFAALVVVGLGVIVIYLVYRAK